MLSIASTTNEAHNAEQDARGQDDDDHDDHDEDPRLQVEAALVVQVAAALVVVEDGCGWALCACEWHWAPLVTSFHVCGVFHVFARVVGRLFDVVTDVGECVDRHERDGEHDHFGGCHCCECGSIFVDSIQFVTSFYSTLCVLY